MVLIILIYVIIIVCFCSGDCGIFTLKTIEFLHARLPLTFTQDNMEFFRKKYAYEVYNKELSI